MLPKSISSDSTRRTATISSSADAFFATSSADAFFATSSADAFFAENRNQSQDQENEKQKFRTPRYVERRKLLYYKGKPKVPHQFPPAPASANRETKQRNSQLPATKPKPKPKKIVKKFLTNRSFSRTRRSWGEKKLIKKKLEKIWRREQQRKRMCAREREDTKTNSQRKKDEESNWACRAVPEEAKGQRPLMGTFNPHFLSFFFFSATFVVFC